MRPIIKLWWGMICFCCCVFLFAIGVVGYGIWRVFTTSEILVPFLLTASGILTCLIYRHIYLIVWDFIQEDKKYRNRDTLKGFIYNLSKDQSFFRKLKNKYLSIKYKIEDYYEKK